MRALARSCVGALLAGGGCRGRDEAASRRGLCSINHSKKSSSSSLSSLPFVSLSFDEALGRARAEKKLVFVDLSADWCSYCTRMDEDVFPDARVKSALLTYVPIKLDTDTAGGRAVANRYRVNGLPAFLLVDGDGELVGRFDGYVPVEPFLAKLSRASREPRLSAPDDPLFAKGLEEFRAGRFFEAHEEWETLWMTADGGREALPPGAHPARCRLRPPDARKRRAGDPAHGPRRRKAGAARDGSSEESRRIFLERKSGGRWSIWPGAATHRPTSPAPSSCDGAFTVALFAF